ncbi:hypothetical protein [Parachryseolinea silvisoli]|jgi:hypothetical protein|uniref:hypothetical protein n=1 Tax=Parachryseolinea silvisoli TaxID=2873601 RepID=UPI002265BFFD|nr:hypothetical protein [Parachryseolinea silvisoli]MCD9016400.1 hypothetical protein [Parachryseolinea silvisoli]
MTLETYLLTFKIQTVLAALVTVLSFIYFDKRQLEVKLLGLTFLLSFLNDQMADILALRGKEVNVASTIYGIVSFIPLSLLYDKALNGRYRKGFTIVAILYLMFAISNLCFVQKVEINTYNYTFSAIVFLFYSILYFYRLMVDLPVQHLHRVPMFWFNAGMLIFNAGTLFLYLFTTYLVEVLHNDLLIYWTFHNIMNVIQLLVVMIGLWQDLRNIKSPSSSLLEP